MSAAYWERTGGAAEAPADRAAGEAARSAQPVAPLPRPLPPRRPLAAPFERGRLGVPASHLLGQPGHHLLGTLGLLPVQGPPPQDALHRLGQIQPRPAQRRE